MLSKGFPPSLKRGTQNLRGDEINLKGEQNAIDRQKSNSYGFRGWDWKGIAITLAEKAPMWRL